MQLAAKGEHIVTFSSKILLFERNFLIRFYSVLKLVLFLFCCCGIFNTILRLNLAKFHPKVVLWAFLDQVYRRQFTDDGLATKLVSTIVMKILLKVFN